MRPLPRVVMLALLVALVATAREGFARKWTDISGNYSVEADYMEVVEDMVDGQKVQKVRLQRLDGKVLRVPLDKLSLADQAYVRQQMGAAPIIGPPPTVPAGPVKPLDLTYFSPDFAAAVIIHPQRIANSPLLKALPQDEAVADMTRELGFDPRKLERVVIAVADLPPMPMPGGPGPGGFGPTPGEKKAAPGPFGPIPGEKKAAPGPFGPIAPPSEPPTKTRPAPGPSRPSILPVEPEAPGPFGPAPTEKKPAAEVPGPFGPSTPAVEPEKKEPGPFGAREGTSGVAAQLTMQFSEPPAKKPAEEPPALAPAEPAGPPPAVAPAEPPPPFGPGAEPPATQPGEFPPPEGEFGPGPGPGPEAAMMMMAADRFALYLHFAEPMDFEPIISKVLDGKYVTANVAGKTYYKQDLSARKLPPGVNLPTGACLSPDNQTLIIAVEPRIQKLLTDAAAPVNSSLVDRLRKLDLNKDLIVVAEVDRFPNARNLITAMAQQQMPRAAHYFKLLEQLKAVTATADLQGDPLIQIDAENKDVDGATALADAAKKGLDMGKAALADWREGFSKEPAGIIFAPIFNMADEVLAGITVTQQANDVIISVKRPTALEQLPDILKPLLEAAQEEARGVREMNNLKQIALAMLNYESAHPTYPPAASQSPDGKPLLSWRVAILPFIEEQALYDQFHLDEPWDSPNNAPLVSKMPEVYAIPGQPNTGKTTIMVFTGGDAPFGGGTGPRIENVTDGTSNTIMAVEAGPDKAVPWTKPEDLTFDATNPKAALGNIGEGFNAAFMDGSVHHIASDVAADVLKALITYAGGEVVRLGDF